MNQTPKAKNWAAPFFLLLIALYVLPKAGVDLIQSNIRIQVEKTRQENLEALTQSVRGNSMETAKLAREIKLSRSMLSTLREIKKISTFLLSFCGLIFIGLMWSVLKQREKTTSLQNV